MSTLRLLAALLVAALFSAQAHATPLDPLSFTSLGTLTPTVAVTIDTDTLLMTGGASFTGVVGPDNIAVFTFDGVSIPASVTITVTGSRAVALLSQGDAVIAGDVRGNASGFNPGPGGYLGGLGGDGSGPGGGSGTASSASAGGGGGFGGGGGRSSFGLLGGGAYGDLASLLDGGSGGGGAGSAFGGGGGGAIEIGAVGLLSVDSGAFVQANGSAGGASSLGAGGGGSGGGILLHGDSVTLLGQVFATGGPGNSVSGRSGGGGGGGRALIQSTTFTVGEVDMNSLNVTGGNGSNPAEDGGLGVATLTAGTTIVPDGQLFTVSDGVLTNNVLFTSSDTDVAFGGQLALDGQNVLGVVTNAGSYTQIGGELDGSLQNSATASIVGDASVTGQVDNRSQLDVAAGGSLSAATLLNSGTLTFDGTLSATTATNQLGGTLSGKGTIAAAFTNDGTLDPTGTLIVTGAMTNGAGSISILSGESLRADGGLSNTGVIDLAGGLLAPTTGVVTNGAGGVIRGHGGVAAPVTNSGGLIHANATETLVVSNLSGGNVAGGELRIEDGSTLLVQSAFASSGTVVLKGPNATMNGGTLTNTGTLLGTGRVSNTIANAGVLRAEGGQLTLSGASNTNTATGRIESMSGTTVFFSQGLASNAGVIALTGGAFDNNGNSLANSGEILGRGTLRTGGLSNSGTIEFADGDSDVFGAVTNDATLNVTGNTTTFFDLVTNGATGTIKNTGGTARFLGGLNNSGAFISDPADNHFTNIILDDTGYLVGGVGDRFLVSGDVLNSSDASVLWKTAEAELALIGGGNHLVQYSAEDLGANRTGYVDNMAWGTLRLGASDALVLSDGDAAPGGALYVTSLLLEGGLAQIASITGNGMNLYYDPTSSDNTILAGRSFALTGGGLLAPVPEPSTALLIGGGLAVMALRRRRERST